MSEMADVTYADLKFMTYAKKPKCSEPRQAGSEEEEQQEGEIMYENLKGPRISESKANPEPARPGKEGFSVFKARSPQITLIVLVACVCLLATSIALGVQLIQVSQQMSEDQEILNINFSQSMRLRDEVLRDTENKLHHTEVTLQETSESLGEVRQDLNLTWEELENVTRELHKTKTQLETTKKEKTTLNSRLQEIENVLSVFTECCSEEWILISGKCLFFSREVKTSLEAKNDCISNKSELLGIKTDDLLVKKYIDEKCLTYWGSLTYHYSSSHKCIWHGGSEKVYYIKENSGEVREATSLYSFPWICTKSTQPIKFQNEFPVDVANYMNCAWKKPSLP